MATPAVARRGGVGEFTVVERIALARPLRIRGTAIKAGISRNWRLYLADELRAAARSLEGKPIYIEHVSAENAVGKVVRAWWDEDEQAIKFEGEIYDDEVADKIRLGLIQHVSIAADYEVLEPFDGVVPYGLRFRELSLVAVPGVPEANIEVVERLIARLHEAFERRADRIAKLYEELEVEEQYSPEERQRLEREREERSRKYGIEVRPDGHLTPPQRFYEEGARTEDDYGDPVNWRYPLHRPENVRAALAYWARFRNYYKRQGSRNVIFKRIVQAAIRYGIVPDWDTWSQYPEARALPEELRRAFRGYPGAPEAAEALSEEGSAGGAEEPTGGEAEDANEPPEGEGESALLDRALTAEGDRPSGSASVCPELAESEGPGPGLKPPSGHEGKGGGSVEEKVSVLPEPKQEDRYEKIAGVLREALKSADAAAAIPTVWTPEIVRKPAGLVANVGDAVRSYPQLRGRPGDKVKVPRLASVEFIELTEGTAPSEPTVTLDGVEVALKEYGQLISITYSVLEDIRPDIVAAIEEMFTEAAKLKEDEVILSKLDGIAEPAATLYGGGKASEADITDADVFTPDLIARALGAIMAQGYLVRPGDSRS